MSTRLWLLPTFVLSFGLQLLLLLSYGISLAAALQDALLFQLILLFSGLMILQMLKFYSPGVKNGAFLLIYTLITAMLASMAHEKISPRIYLFVPQDQTAMLMGHMTIRTVFAWLILVIVALSEWFSGLLTEQKQQTEKQKELEKLSAEAELFHLRQQMQPHFLFNSLNSIYALIGSKPIEARDMTLKLAEFLRGTVDKGTDSMSRLSEEISLIKTYLAIEQVRFGDRLTVEITQPDDRDEWPVPGLLLQPLVENAIKHGLAQQSAAMQLMIKVEAASDEVKVTVSNPAAEKPLDLHKRKGFGLHSVKRRLQLIYHRNDLLQIQQAHGLFEVTVTLPKT